MEQAVHYVNKHRHEVAMCLDSGEVSGEDVTGRERAKGGTGVLMAEARTDLHGINTLANRKGLHYILRT